MLQEKTIFLIVGMHRSGTSMLASIMHTLGANLGAPLNIEPVPSNPSGHWEHDLVWRLQEKLLTDLEAPWHDGFLSLPPEWLQHEASIHAARALERLICDSLQDNDHWLVKDPRSSLLLPLWQRVCDKLGIRLRLIVTVRHPAEVCQSLQARNGMSQFQALRLWEMHYQYIQRYSSGLDSITVMYDQLFNPAEAVLSRLQAFCGLPASEEKCQAGYGLVNAAYRHHRAGSTGTPGPSAAETDTQASVLIVTRTRWREWMLSRCLLDVLSQTYPHWILQVVNDGGNAAMVDRILAVYEPFMRGRLHVLHLSAQVGMEAASNLGIRQHKAGFVAIHDDDDTWHPEFLERMVGHLESTGGHAVVCHSDMVFEDVSPGRYEPVDTQPFCRRTGCIRPEDLAVVNQFPPISLLYRQTVHEQTGFYQESLPVLGDWAFNKQLAQLAPLDLLPEVLAFWHRRTDTSQIGNSPISEHLRFTAFVRDGHLPLVPPGYFPRARTVTLHADAPASCAVTQASALEAGTYLLHSAAMPRGQACLFSVDTPAALGEALPALATPLSALPMNDLRLARLSALSAELSWHSASARLPDVLCIGAQRAGTTWLHAMLSRHERIWQTPIKEYHFLDRRAGRLETLAGSQQAGMRLAQTAPDRRSLSIALRYAFPESLSWDWYSSLLADAPADKLVCDFTPAYAMSDEGSIFELTEYCPKARIIFILRDPVDRAISGAFHQLRQEGRHNPGHAEIARECRRDRNRDRTDYRQALTAWRRRLTADQLLVLSHDDLVNSPADTLLRVCRFLAIEPLDLPADTLQVALNAGNPAQQSSPSLQWLRKDLTREYLPLYTWLAETYPACCTPWLIQARNRLAVNDTAGEILLRMAEHCTTRVLRLCKRARQADLPRRVARRLRRAIFAR